ncbi:Coenzyme Q-binding protein COQ10 START domain-containing protein OS=Streptomyces violarus OX=67380 GN=FHS41_006230 PE=4 SV=1 [Streptomyces violarus]
MDWNHYRFRTLWTLPAPPAPVYEALERAEDSPVVAPGAGGDPARRHHRGWSRIRSVLPYDMTFTAREVRRKPEAGVLEIALSGDMEGWARWTVTPDGTGTRVRYDQVVDVRKPLLRRLAVPCRPAFRANHRLMMRTGARGLARHLRTV